ESLVHGAVAAHLPRRQIAETDARAAIDVTRHGAGHADFDVIGMRAERQKVDGRGGVRRRHAVMLLRPAASTNLAMSDARLAIHSGSNFLFSTRWHGGRRASMVVRMEQEYVLGTHDQEIERLGVQHRAWRALVLSAWRRAGLEPARTVLDV